MQKPWMHERQSNNLLVYLQVWNSLSIFIATNM